MCIKLLFIVALKFNESEELICFSNFSILRSK